MTTNHKTASEIAAEIREEISTLPGDKVALLYEVMSSLLFPLPSKAPAIICEKTGAPLWMVREASKYFNAVARNPEMRHEFEARLLSGDITFGPAYKMILARLRARVANAIKEKAPAAATPPSPGTGAHVAAQLNQQWQDAGGADTGAKALARLRSNPKGQAAVEAAKPRTRKAK